MTQLHSPVVSTQWLADHLGADDLLVVDATVLPYTQPNGKQGYLSGHESYLINGHLPGAVFADLVDEFSDPDGAYPFTRPDLERFTAVASELGVGPDTAVVVYDAAVGQWASRLWWLLRTFGFDNVAILDGGSQKWIAEGRDLSTGHVAPVPATFLANERTHLWVEKADVQDIVDGTATAALVCAVPPREFTGEAGPGHIPGSLGVPAGRLVDRDTNALLPLEQLRELFAPVLGQERIVAYCKGGIAASADALVLTLLGHTNVAIYDNSLNEWATKGELVTTAG
jgi:thiosulfate/3-mercaptopyruvate sulfurtransferase